MVKNVYSSPHQVITAQSEKYSLLQNLISNQLLLSPGQLQWNIFTPVKFQVLSTYIVPWADILMINFLPKKLFSFNWPIHGFLDMV